MPSQHRHRARLAAFPVPDFHGRLSLIVIVGLTCHNIVNSQQTNLVAAQTRCLEKLQKRLPVRRLEVAIVGDSPSRTSNGRPGPPWKHHLLRECAVGKKEAQR